MSNIREKNIEVFEDTKRLCETNSRLIYAIHKSTSKQYIVTEKDKIKTTKEHRFKNPAEVFVSQKRSFEAAREYGGQKVCVHNFASSTSPGGGVLNGSSAHEVALCRFSTLYFNISKPRIVDRYHNHHKRLIRENKMDVTYNDDCIYTPGVVVFKSDIGTPELLDESDWYNVDIITCAAPNLRPDSSNIMNQDAENEKIQLTAESLRNLHIKRICRILEIAKCEKEDVVILGAFGCGAFYNPPQIVAEAMKIAIKEYQYDFKTIEFAVFCTPKDVRNYEVFSQILQS